MISLHDLIKQDPPPIATIERVITQASANPEDLTSLLHERGNRGKTPLHLACEKAHFNVVKILLSHGADCNLRDLEQQTPHQLIESSEELEKCKIVAYIKLHQRREKTTRLLGIDLPRTFYLIERAIESMEESPLHQQENAVLIVGETRLGKSTLVNFLLGTLYRLHESQMVPIESPDNPPERAQVGRGLDSETLHPSSYSHPEKPYALIDMPGGEDNRGDTEGENPYSIAAGVSVALLHKRLSSIKAIILTIRAADLDTDNINVIWKPYRRVASYIVNNPTLLSRQLIFILTKPDKMFHHEFSTAEEWIQARISSIKTHLQNKIRRGEHDGMPDAFNHIIKKFTPENTLVADIQKKTSYERIHELIASKTAVSSKDYSFGKSCREMKSFLQFVTHVNSELSEIESEIAQKKRQLDLIKREINNTWHAVLSTTTCEDDISEKNLDVEIRSMLTLALPTLDEKLDVPKITKIENKLQLLALQREMHLELNSTLTHLQIEELVDD